MGCCDDGMVLNVIVTVYGSRMLISVRAMNVFRKKGMFCYTPHFTDIDLLKRLKLQIMNIRSMIFFLLPGLLSACTREINADQFPGSDFERVIAYRMNGEDGEVIEDGTISDKVVSEGVLLNHSQARKLLMIFQDPSTYGEAIGLCFDPHIGYVFYDEREEVVAYTTICLHCNWMKTSPEIGGYVFSERGNERLARLEKRIFDR